MKDDIRKATGVIIRRGREYLVGTILYSTDLRWSIYPGDAWITRNREKAQRVADMVGGELMLYNPVVRQMREIEKVR